MAIAVSCSSCQHGLRVKDELAGKKIRCPKCQGLVTVPAATAETRVSSKPLKPAPAARHDEEEEDDRPRKKKKKKKSASNMGMYIGLGVGGIAVVGVAVLVVMLMANRTPEKKGPDLNQPAPVNRIVGRDEDEASLKTLGAVYRDYCTKNQKGPENLKDLEPELKDHSKVLRLLTEGKITCQWGVVPDRLEHEKKALAYDSKPNEQGLRFVLLGDNRVLVMDASQFERTQKITTAVVVAPDPTRPPKIKVGGIPRFKDKIEAQNALRGVAIAYVNYAQQMSRAPTKLEDLEPYYDKNPRITEAIKVGTLKIVWGQRVAEGGQTLLAFETDSDATGRRMIVTASTAPTQVTDAEFEEIVKDLPK